MRAGLVACLIGLAACGAQTAPEGETGFETAISGSHFLQPDTRALQADDFANPGYLWVDRGKGFFRLATETGPACASCHTDETRPLKGAAARYPAIDAESGELFNLERRINACRMRHQNAPPLEYESEELLSLTAYVAELSRGQPFQVDISGAAAKHYEAGRAYFFTRRGQLNLSCHQCHDRNWGRQLRGDTISQGHPNGFPAYRFEWQSFGSLHRRFEDCDAGVRAEPMAPGSDAYLALELYLAARASGLSLESPGVRR